MAKLAYSGDAINVLNKFHACDYIVYVEGDDDNLFWKTIFDKCSKVKIKTEPVGGSCRIDEKIDRVISENLKVIVARDTDFLAFCDKKKNDPRILYTYGYSIENTLYTTDAIAKIAYLLTKGKYSKESHALAASHWMNALYKTAQNMIELDIANAYHKCGLEVTGENIAKFAKKGISHAIDQEKLRSHLNAIAAKITKKMVKTALNAGLTYKPTDRWIRGHFLASAVLQFIIGKIKAAGINIQLNKGALYTDAIQHLENVIKENVNSHYDHYFTSTANAIRFLKKGRIQTRSTRSKRNSERSRLSKSD